MWKGQIGFLEESFIQSLRLTAFESTLDVILFLFQNNWCEITLLGTSFVKENRFELLDRSKNRRWKQDTARQGKTSQGWGGSKQPKISNFFPSLSDREVRETEGSREFEILCGAFKSCPNVLHFFGLKPVEVHFYDVHHRKHTGLMLILFAGLSSYVKTYIIFCDSY